MSDYHALIIDDEPDIRELLALTLKRMKIMSTQAENITQAKQRVSAQPFDLCITDMNLPDGNGIDFVKYVAEHHPTLPIAVLTAYGNMDIAVTALKAGAFDFVSKPVDLKRLRDLVTSAIKLKDAKQPTLDTLQQNISILGTSAPVQTLLKQIQKVARSQAPIYIYGESGSGKELVARQIHELGPRSDGPFIPVNCGAIPDELMESEFFGHCKGSFTGASEDKTGLFLAANGGTLFLDEVADLPLHMQVKLLRAIQEKAVRPIGKDKEISTDIRILSATHKDLSSLVESGDFRQDLFYRINVIQLNVPPLRERQDDIDLLTRFFLDKLANEWQTDRVDISDSALDALRTYQFPGNVRELENILERAATLCDDDVIESEHLNLPSDHVQEPSAVSEPLTNSKPLATPESSAVSEPSAVSKPSPESAATLDVGGSLEEYLTDIEKKAILNALEDTRWNRTAAAKKLGMSFRSLRYRLKKLGLDQENE